MTPPQYVLDLAASRLARWVYVTIRLHQALAADCFLGEIVYAAPEWR